MQQKTVKRISTNYSLKELSSSRLW